MNESSDMHARTAPEGASTDEVVSALDANRAALDQTLSEIEQRLSPEGLMNAAVEYLRGGAGTEYVRGLRDSVVHNPLPVTLTAIGLAWTMFGERSAPRTASGQGSHYAHDAAEGAKGAAEGAKGAASAMGDKARAGMGAARRGVEGARSRLSQGRERMAGMSDAAAARYRESADLTRDFAREHPMVLAGAGLALGAALAALLPPTRTEDENLGPVRDRTIDRAREAASEQGEHLRQRAEEIRDAARTEAQRQGLTGDRLSQAMEDAENRVRHVADAAKQEASREGPGAHEQRPPSEHH